MAKDNKSKELDTRVFIAIVITAVVVGWVSGFAVGLTLGKGDESVQSTEFISG